MAILQECPICNNKQSVKNKKCKCGANLDKFKKTGKIRYWINFKIPGGKYRREFVSNSIEDARAADGKRKVQKKEGRIFDMLPEARLTFNELTEWYLALTSIKDLGYYKDLRNNLGSFNQVFGATLINDVTPEDLKEYQLKRKKEGYADSYIDKHTGAARTMVNRAFENGKINGDGLKPFRLVKRLLKNSRANARDRVLTIEEYQAVFKKLPIHLKPIWAMGYYTGMRLDEILSLVWDKVDFQRGFIHLEASDTKDNEKRSVPIVDELRRHLEQIPRGLHEDHVFLYRGKPVKDIRTGLKNACEKANVLYGQKTKGGIIFHDLRHTFNTNMRKAGVTESVIMEITGHATREMFDRYNTIDAGDKKQGVNQLSFFLAEQENRVNKNVDQNGKR